MLPTSTSNKSFTQQKRIPPGQKPLVARSSSFLGTIKNIVTAPLAWFAQDDGFEDTKGKRRRLEQNADVRAVTEDGVSRNKRMRVNSPEKDDQLYLDPPEQIFKQPHSAPSGSGFPRPPTRTSHPAPISRSTSVTTPSSNVHRQSRNNRHTVSPLRTSFTQADIISRTMSMDPPTRPTHTRDITMSPYRDGNRHSMSVPRDISMSPTRPPFLMRTSLTPQPSGSSFGPALQHQQKYHEHTSEPPSIEELMANPKFVRPPQELSHQRNSSKEPVITLGSLVDSQRSTRSPSRPHSSLLFGPQGAPAGTSSAARSTNAAEKALHELDVYKTPLLPSRLRGSTTIPDMFKPKPGRSHTPIFMRPGKDQKPKLGKNKDKKQEVNGTKPYAGEGGLKKLLARRKLEEEEERKQEKANAMDDGETDVEEVVATKKTYVEQPTEKVVPEYEKQQGGVPAIPPLPKFRFDPSFDKVANNLEQSSLRVGRTRTSRNHISRPTARSKNRFSAVYEDDDEDDQMLEEKNGDVAALEEVAKKVPVFRVPEGFSFAKEASQIQHDLSTAKEPPITALPFSLTKPLPSQASIGPSAPPASKEPEQISKPASSFFAQPSASSTAQQPPSISVTTPTPEPVKTVTEPPSTSSGIPNFFANSPALNKPISATPAEGTGSSIPNFFANSAALAKPPSMTPPPSTSLNVPNFFANSAALNKSDAMVSQQPKPSSVHANPTTDADNPLWEGEKEKSAMDSEEAKPSQFGELAKPASTPPLFGGSSAAANNTSAFGVGLEKSDSLFGSSPAPAKVQPAPAAPVFGDMPPAKIEPIVSVSTFGAPTKPVETTQKLSTTGPEPKIALTTVHAPVEAPKVPPLFGTAPVSSFAGFNGPTPTTTELKPGFAFGQPASGASTSVEAPKPLFGSEPASAFSFGQRPNSAPIADTKPPTTSPFSFGAAPSTPPAGAEKKAPFIFGPSPVTAAPTGGSPFSFGPPSGSSNGTDVSHKPFAFGSAAAAPARPVTPKNEQEFRMEESPTREMNLNGKPPEVPRLATSGFSFGATSAPSSATSLFGQNTQSGQGSPGSFAFGGPPSAPLSNPFAKPEAKTESKSSGFTEFGQNTTSSAFSFDQKPGEISRAPSSSGAFSFGQATAAPAATSSFAFGPAQIASHPFSQTASNAGSAPNSPSTFNHPTPFSFTSPTVTNNPFAFGSSQPASPASGNVSLPQSSSGGAFTFGQSSGAAQTSSSFPAQSTAPPAGGSLFTIGSAPSPAPSSTGGRAIKKLPNRSRLGKR